MLGLALATASAASSSSSASAFSPASLAPRAWYDPNDLTTLYDSGTRAAPGTPAVVGGPVGLMLDKSGNNMDATASGIGRPILQQAGAFYYLDFDGGSNSMLLPTGLLTGLTAGTAIFAAKKNVDPPAGGGTAGPLLAQFGPPTSYYPFTDGTIYGNFLTDTRKDTGIDPGNMAAWHVGDFRSGAGLWKGGFNGTDYYTTATNTVSPGTAPNLGSSENGNVWFAGFAGRILLFNSVLTGTSLANARTWVGAGSGLAL